MALDQFIRGVISTDSVYQRRKTRRQIATDPLLVEGPIRGITQSADLVILYRISIDGGY
jgi:hypothetical protein